LAALGVNGLFVSYPSSEPARVIIWNYESGEVVKELEGLIGKVEEVGFSPDGKLLVAGCHDDKLRRWDTSTWEELPAVSAHANGVRALAFSSDGALLATASGLRTDRFVGGEIKLWRAADAHPLATIAAHRDAVRAVRFAQSDGTLITAADDGEVAFWNIADPVRPRTGKRFFAHSLGISDFDVSPDGQFLGSSGGDSMVRIWNITNLLAEPDPVVRLGPHASELMNCAWDRDGSAIWTGDKGNTATLWDVAAGEVRNTISTGSIGRTYLAACDADGLLILGGTDQSVSPMLRKIVCYDTATGEKRWATDVVEIRNIYTEISPTRRPDGVRLASIPTPHDLVVVNAASGSEISRLSAGAAWNRFSRDGRMLAVAPYDSKQIHLYDTITWKIVSVLQCEETWTAGIAISPDGQFLAAGGSDNVVRIWKIATGQLIKTCAGHDDDIFCVDYSPDGKRIVSAGKDLSVRLWDAATGECVLRLSEPQGWVTRAYFSPDGRQIAASSTDRYVYVWRLATSRETADSGRTLADTVIVPADEELPIEVTPADWRIVYYRWEPPSGVVLPSASPAAEVFDPQPIREQRATFIDFDWKSGSPASGVPADYFALVATATLELNAGQYTVAALSDDGVRVYFDGQRVIDDWAARPPAVNTADLTVESGRHDIRIEYFELGNGARLHFGIVPTTPQP
jgi:WD40 repeat protein